MKDVKCVVLVLFTFAVSLTSNAQSQRYNAVYSGVPWFDNNGNIVSAHGGGIIKDHGRYYLFGERHADTSNVFTGFNCYSSADLYNWKFESIALPTQDTGRLGPNRVGERVKVMKCPQTGEYVMFMHTDDRGYKDQCVGYATAKNITGPYSFHGPLLYKGQPIRKWDMGTFQDEDGAGYVLIHGGEIYKLSADYHSATELLAKDFAPNSEAPAVLRKGNTYYWLGSHLTSWERNDNFYYTATSMKGPWTYRGSFAPEGTLTWNSQTTFVLPVTSSKETTFIFMGDRWSFPHQTSSATYIWQPMTVSGNSISIPKYQQAWQINQASGMVSPVQIGHTAIDDTDLKHIAYSGNWNTSIENDVSQHSSDVKGASFSVKFNGRQIGLMSLQGPTEGYALISLKDSKGKTVLNSMIDLYCKYPVPALSFLSPAMKKDNYILTVTVAGEHGTWSDKKKNIYGSTGNFVSIDKLIITE